MDAFQMVVLIVAIITLGGVIRSKNGTRRGKGGARPVEDQMENQLLRSEIKELKERIAVLERLATDTHSAAALDREIEKLR